MEGVDHTTWASAYDEGFNAAADARTDSNPYPSHGQAHLAWHDGYTTGLAIRHEQEDYPPEDFDDEGSEDEDPYDAIPELGETFPRDEDDYEQLSY